MSAALWLTAVIALLDGAFSGYRAAQGRTGRLPSWRRDAVAHLRGVVVWVLLVAAPIAVGIALVPVGTRLEAARALLPLLVPYALLTLLAVAAWCVLPWRVRYVAMALVLGPLSLLRPVACLAAPLLVAAATHDVAATLLTALLAACQLAVEPIAGRATNPPRAF